MVQISSIFVLTALAALASAAPIRNSQFQKRIAQVIADSTASWEQACLAAGGAQQCNPISQQAFTSLLAAGKNCDQQDAADAMIDLAKTLKNDAEMIRLAQIFVQQPRNAVSFWSLHVIHLLIRDQKPDSLQVPYCQVAPKNTELTGLFHCQFAGSNFDKFSGDQTGNLPLGVNTVSPPGSCPAKTDGPVPDGVQLNTLVQSPGVGAGGSAATSDNGAPDAGTVDTVDAESQAPPVATTAPATPSAASGGFQLQNGKDAKALNDKFASLTASSTCTDGEQACVASGFAQCVGGKFTITQCAGGTICAALPLVNKAGTSITCTTAADRDARIAATGA
ncbi:hypothetical protein H0H87_006345 [Tephrocybe sp. NHM501043]|nr:hypothetical protein H0H87_006345 [Tephrocybe sp. NHM501043]